MRFAFGSAAKRDGFCRQKRSIRFLLEGCADGVCAGGRVAGSDVDLFSRTGAGAVVIRAVGYVAGNAVIFFAGVAGFFRRIVVHDGSSFQSKNLERHIVLSYPIVCPIAPFYAVGSRIFKFTFRGSGIYHSRNARISLLTEQSDCDGKNITFRQRRNISLLSHQRS